MSLDAESRRAVVEYQIERAYKTLEVTKEQLEELEPQTRELVEKLKELIEL